MKSLAAVQPTAAKHDYASFVTKKVAGQADGVWTTGTIQCLHQGILQSMTRQLPADTILPNKSQPFSIVWADNTDSICDLPSVLTFLDNHASNCHHRTNASRSSPATNGSARRTLMVRQPLPPIFLLSPTAPSLSTQCSRGCTCFYCRHFRGHSLSPR